MPVRPIRVLCADDHPMMTEAMRFVLTAPDFELVETLNSVADLLEAVERAKPHVVLVDVVMPGPDVFAAIEDLRRRHEDVHAIVYSGFVRDHYVDAAVCSGAWGYAYKGDPIAELLNGIRSVADGVLFFSSGVVERTTMDRAGAASRMGQAASSSLTVREQEVLRLIGRGLSRAQIAQTLARSPNTITGHTHAIMKKLEISSRVGLVRYAIAEGLAEASQT